MMSNNFPSTPGAAQVEFRRRNSLEWQLIAPIPVIVILAMALIWFIVPDVVAKNSTNDAIRGSVQIAEQFKTIRAYYTNNVVSKVVKSGTLKPGIDHKSDSSMVPLPATMIHDLSELLSKKDTTVNLYSRYPFPNRKDRKLDNFQQEAWEYLNANPTATFSRNESRDGRQFVRVAVADTMVAQACVNCHNSDQASPKTDWKVGDVRGILEVNSVIDNQLAAGASLSRSIIIGALLIGMVLLVISILAARRVTKPLQGLTETMRRLVSGDLDAAPPGTDRKDEIGMMARAVLVFRDAAIEKIRLEGQTEEQRRQAEEERQRNADAQAQATEERSRAQAKVAAEQSQAVQALAEGLSKVAAGNLAFRLTDGFTDSYKQIRDDFNATIAQLQATMQSIAAAVREVTNSSAEISTSTTDLSQRTEEQAASLEETSASMEEIAATVKKNAENAKAANQSATETREVAGRGGEIVAKAVHAMAKIEESSGKISDIIGVIDEIARQTNLLALNAAVEAARAGDAGRGFAVVASEVRSLAQRSSQAAKDIKDLITNSNGQVKDGVDLVNRVGGALSDIVESVKKVADIVSDIAVASTEQADGIDQVNKALTQMDEVTQQNSALVEENAATAKTLEQQAKAMDEQVAFFRLAEGGNIDVPKTAPQPVVTLSPKPARSSPARARQGNGAAAHGPVGQVRAAIATAMKAEQDWKEF